jgi:hypothetical protein
MDPKDFKGTYKYDRDGKIQVVVAKNPKRDMPIGILGSLVVCTILYILFGHVLTGVAPWTDFVDPEKGREASVAYAISTYMTGYGWLATAVTVAILAGFVSGFSAMKLFLTRLLNETVFMFEVPIPMLPDSSIIIAGNRSRLVI